VTARTLAEGVVDHDTQYWLQAAVGVPFLVLWLGISLGLAIAAYRMGSSPRLGRLAVWTVVCLGAFTAAFGTLALWYPPWYRPAADLVARLLLFPIGLSFLITLTCCIASAQRTAEARRLCAQTGAIIGVAVLGLNASQVFLDGWAKVAADLLAASVLAGGLALAGKAQSRAAG
jgi:hypothetical protein